MLFPPPPSPPRVRLGYCVGCIRQIICLYVGVDITGQLLLKGKLSLTNSVQDGLRLSECEEYANSEGIR